MNNHKIIFPFIALLVFKVAAFAQANKASGGDTITYQEKYRPQYHLTSPQGALFDPTDLVYYDSLYHVNRGVAISPDLVYWKTGKRQSLSTDSVREMSGSLVIDSLNTGGFGNNGQVPQVAVYSGLRKNGQQIQCIAYSTDKGAHWVRYEKNPVIDIHSTEFRDPQVFWYPKEKKWVMVVALAAERKIRFYGSPNLKDWKLMSDFGPYGAVNGVWECPDLFRLPVSNAPGEFKWVLEVSVQPVGGQYFIGDFDGVTFTADPVFRQIPGLAKPLGDVIFDFENGLPGWTKTGGAFDSSPSEGALAGQNAVFGYYGKRLINSFNKGDKTTGELVSPLFVITRKYLNFLIGGGLYNNAVCANLVVDGKIVRTSTGTDTEVLHWAGWDVSELTGKEARIGLVDHEQGGFGHILFDELLASDTPAENDREKAYWLDYGPDFYAVRSWVNGPAKDDRRVSVAWASSWQYAFKVPTAPWKGGHTFPRSEQIMKDESQYTLLQNPIEEIKTLRTGHFSKHDKIIGPSSWSVDAKNKNSYELVIDCNIAKGAGLELKLCSGVGKGTVITYNAETELLKIDRSRSGITDFSPVFPAVYSAPLKLKNSRLKLHILVDRSLVELFANDGAVNMTCLIFPGEKDTGISLKALRGKVELKSLDLWNLKSIWTSN